MTTDRLRPAIAAVTTGRSGGRRHRLMVAASVVVLALVGPWTLRHAGDRASAAEAATPPAGAAPLARSAESLETQFLSALNTRRRHRGLPPLASDPRMVAVARDWAGHMVGDGDISHNPDLASHMPEDWRKYGENVGVGDTVTSLHEAFLASPHHYVNIVDPQFNAVGVGVAIAYGRIWVVFDFLASASAPAATPATTALPS